ncbi:MULTISPECIES: ROK family protein [Devosia]|uniref:ROK family protein n=1 Tax=Devosia TaxID=46913 RepID=UPI001FE4E8DE|nr:MULTISPECIES: ROK family protein [Devosia]
MAEEKTTLRSVGRPRSVDAAQASLALLLNLVRTGAATTRQELERRSELGRAVVADRLATMIELGLLKEGELGQATGGRAPRQMRFRHDAGSLLVSAIDQSSIALGIADLNGQLLVEHHEAAQLDAGPEAILDRLATIFDWQLRETEKPAPWGIGLALPGPIEKPAADFETVPVLQTVQSWQGFPFLDRLSIRFGVPIFARSGVQTMTMGEAKAGGGRGLSDIIYVKLGRSISAGLISEGQLHRGAQGAAGMIGHSRVGDELLEAVAGAEAIAREGKAAAEDGRSPYLAQTLERQGELSVVDIGHAAQLGDLFCVELLGKCGRLVGEALAPLTNLVNPSLIVIGGVVAESGGDSLLAGIREAVYRQSHPMVSRDLQIMRSQMGASSGLVGAAQVVVEELFAPTTLQGWVGQGSPLHHPEFQKSLERATVALATKAAQPAGRVAP